MSRISILNRSVRTAIAGLFFVGLLSPANATSQHDAWERASAGFIGVSDGWQDFATNGAMTWTYTQAGPGNVALLGELSQRQVVLALGFGGDRESAATLAISALLQPFEAAWHRHIRAWEGWHAETVDTTGCPPEFRDLLHISAMVLRRTTTRPTGVAWWQASASPGAAPRATSGVIILCGHATLWRLPVPCSRLVQRMVRATFCAT